MTDKDKTKQIDALIDDEGTGSAAPEENVLRFEDLVQPATHYFELEDGTNIPFKSFEKFDSTEMGQLQRAQRAFERNMELMIKNPKDTKVAIKLEKNASAIILLACPDMPQEVLDGFVLGQKLNIVNFWNKIVAGIGEEADPN